MSVNKEEEMFKFREKLRNVHMNAQMGINLYGVNAPKKPRLSRRYPEHAGEYILKLMVSLIWFNC